MLRARGAKKTIAASTRNAYQRGGAWLGKRRAMWWRYSNVTTTDDRVSAGIVASLRNCCGACSLLAALILCAHAHIIARRAPRISALFYILSLINDSDPRRKRHLRTKRFAITSSKHVPHVNATSTNAQ